MSYPHRKLWKCFNCLGWCLNEGPLPTKTEAFFLFPYFSLWREVWNSTQAVRHSSAPFANWASQPETDEVAVLGFTQIEGFAEHLQQTWVCSHFKISIHIFLKKKAFLTDENSLIQMNLQKSFTASWNN